jgi:hypothetical protein
LSTLKGWVHAIAAHGEGTGVGSTYVLGMMV